MDVGVLHPGEMGQSTTLEPDAHLWTRSSDLYGGSLSAGRTWVGNAALVTGVPGRDPDGAAVWDVVASNGVTYTGAELVAGP